MTLNTKLNYLSFFAGWWDCLFSGRPRLVRLVPPSGRSGVRTATFALVIVAAGGRFCGLLRRFAGNDTFLNDGSFLDVDIRRRIFGVTRRSSHLLGRVVRLFRFLVFVTFPGADALALLVVVVDWKLSDLFGRTIDIVTDLNIKQFYKSGQLAQ